MESFKNKVTHNGCVNCGNKSFTKKLWALICDKCEAIYTHTAYMYYPNIDGDTWKTKQIKIFKDNGIV